MFNKQTEGEIQNEVLFIWKGNRSSYHVTARHLLPLEEQFCKVIPLLADTYHVLCVSYDGFDKTEETEFTTMLEETEKSRIISGNISADISGQLMDVLLEALL